MEWLSVLRLIRAPGYTIHHFKEDGMSEYQYVAFRAVDAPISSKNLQFMREQSSRAAITSRSFTNEYHYGNFKGNVPEMLRRGYDVHLHFANYGTRDIHFRFPQGLPHPHVAAMYDDGESITFLKDKSGPGTILHVSPCHDSGFYDGYYEGLEELIDTLVDLRAEMLDGDLRPLYLMHLAAARDDYHEWETTPEAPVPAMLHKLTPAQETLVDFYEIPSDILTAAATGNTDNYSPGKQKSLYSPWLKKQSAAKKDQWLKLLMEDANATVRADMLAAYHKDQPDNNPWPTKHEPRMIAELERLAEGTKGKKK